VQISSNTQIDYPGRLLYVIGRSGVGKDSIINAIKPYLPENVRIIRRYITREEDFTGECHYPISSKQFDIMLKNGDFCLHWESHGLKYGIGLELKDFLKHGLTVIVNGSREYLTNASKIFSRFEAIEITAETSIIVNRLINRNRETAESITERLERGMKDFSRPERLTYHTLDNSKDLSDTVSLFMNIICAPCKGVVT
jgi:ribose 1,5-bisphosphokinase